MVLSPTILKVYSPLKIAALTPIVVVEALQEVGGIAPPLCDGTIQESDDRRQAQGDCATLLNHRRRIKEAIEDLREVSQATIRKLLSYPQRSAPTPKGGDGCGHLWDIGPTLSDEVGLTL